MNQYSRGLVCCHLLFQTHLYFGVRPPEVRDDLLAGVAIVRYLNEVLGGGVELGKEAFEFRSFGAGEELDVFLGFSHESI